MTLPSSRLLLAVAVLARLFYLVMSFSKKKKHPDWNSLIGDNGLKHWQLADPVSTGTADWTTSGGVQLQPENPKLLQYDEDGSSIIVNGQMGKTENLFSRMEHGGTELHVEFLISEGSNSGIYFMGRYEIQVKDSWGKNEVGPYDSGAIYERWDPKRGEGKEGYEGHAPRVNASRKPGEWETYDIVFCAPQFDAEGEKMKNAEFVKIVQNGMVIHENVQVTGPTRAGAFEDEQPTGPLILQGDHGPVAYRNIRIRPLE